MRSHPIHTRGKVWNFGRETARVQWSEATARTVPPSGGRWPLGREPKGGGDSGAVLCANGGRTGQEAGVPLGASLSKTQLEFPLFVAGLSGQSQGWRRPYTLHTAEAQGPPPL